MHELTYLDLGIIVLYMIGMLLIGVWFVKRIKNTRDYYVAGRILGPFVLTATVCASIIGGSAMMGRAGIAYTTGFKANWTKATSQGIIAAMAGGFLVTVGWKLAGNPLGLGETVPGAIVCGCLLVGVSLATYKNHPSEMA